MENLVNYIYIIMISIRHPWPSWTCGSRVPVGPPLLRPPASSSSSPWGLSYRRTRELEAIIIIFTCSSERIFNPMRYTVYTYICMYLYIYKYLTELVWGSGIRGTGCRAGIRRIIFFQLIWILTVQFWVFIQ